MGRKRKQKEEKKLVEAKDKILLNKLKKGHYAVFHITPDGKYAVGMCNAEFIDGGECLRLDYLEYVGKREGVGVGTAKPEEIKSLPGMAHIINWDKETPML